MARHWSSWLFALWFTGMAAVAVGQRRAVEQVAVGIRVLGSPAPFHEIGIANCFDRSPDGRWLVFGTMREIVLVEQESRRVVERKRVPLPIWHVRFSPDNRRVAALLYEPTIALAVEQPDAVELRAWDVVTGRFVFKQQIAADDATDFSAPAFSPDGTLLALAGRQGEMGNLMVFGVRSEERLFRTESTAWARDVAFDRTGEALFFIADDRLWRWNYLDGDAPRELWPRMELDDVSHMVYHAKRHLMVVTLRSGGIALVDLASRRVDRPRGDEPSPPAYHQVTISDDGRRFAVEQRMGLGPQGRFERRIRVGRTSDGRWIRQIPISGPGLQGLTFGRRSDELLFSMMGQYGVTPLSMKPSKVAGREDSSVTDRLTGPVQSVAWAADGESLFLGSRAGDLIELNGATGQTKRRIPTNGLVDVSVNRSTDRLAYRPYLSGEPVQLYDLEHERYVVGMLAGQEHEGGLVPRALRLLKKDVADEREPDRCDVRQVHFSIDGTRLFVLAACGEGVWRASAWHAGDGRLLWRRNLELHPEDIQDGGGRRASLSDDGRWMAVVGRERILVSDVETGQRQVEIESSFVPQHMDFRSDRHYLLGRSARRCAVWSLPTGEPVIDNPMVSGELVAARFVDSDRLVSVVRTDEGGRIEMWDLAAGRTMWVHPLGLRPGQGVDATLDGDRLAIGLSDGRVMVVDVARIGELPH